MVSLFFSGCFTAYVFLYNDWFIWLNWFLRFLRLVGLKDPIEVQVEDKRCITLCERNYGIEIWETQETKNCNYHFLLSHKGRRQKLRSGFFSETFFFPKGLKMMFLYSIRLKMDQKGHIINQKG